VILYFLTLVFTVVLDANNDMAAHTEGVITAHVMH